jgi:Transposase IS116/IS110/IS902 family
MRRPRVLAESRKHKAAKLLRQIPCIGPIRAARLLALMQTPHRFRSKRQLWTYISTLNTDGFPPTLARMNAPKNTRCRQKLRPLPRPEIPR